MANKERGEVSLEIDGKAYTMALTIDAMVRLEDLFSTDKKVLTFAEITGFADRGSIKHVRGLIWAVLTDHHPTLTIDDVTKLIEKSGGLIAFKDKLEAVAQAAGADPKDLQIAGMKSPQPAQVDKGKPHGTGESSTSQPVASA